MHLFASHFGCYEVDYHGAQPVLVPFRKDPEPSIVGQSYLELAQDQARLRRPLARKGWLAGDGGRARGDDEFVEISSDEAVDRAAEALRSVRARHGDSSVFAGSYGWASAGRFHNPQTHLKRFLKLTGGFTSSRHTYSFGAAEVLLPRLVGSAFADPAGLAPQWDDIVSARPFLLSFGGMRRSNAQVGAGGVGQHMTSEWLDLLKAAGGEMLTISPDADDAPFGAHLKINAGTDVFVLLALAYELVERGQQDEDFLTRCCSGWPKICRLLSGELDGRPKTPEWAAQATGISAAKLREIATKLGGAGEPYQSGLVSAAILCRRAALLGGGGAGCDLRSNRKSGSRDRLWACGDGSNWHAASKIADAGLGPYGKPGQDLHSRCPDHRYAGTPGGAVSLQWSTIDLSRCAAGLVGGWQSVSPPPGSGPPCPCLENPGNRYCKRPDENRDRRPCRSGVAHYSAV